MDSTKKVKATQQKMTKEHFFELVQIRTKFAGIFPFVIAVLFTNTYFHSFHPGKTFFSFSRCLRLTWQSLQSIIIWILKRLIRRFTNMKKI